MRTKFLLLLVLVPVLEIWIMVLVSRKIGIPATVLAAIFTAVLGISIARTQGVQVLFKIREKLGTGMMPAEQLIDGALIAAAGLMLLIPGFVSDTAGAILLVPFFRKVFARGIQKRFGGLMNGARSSAHPGKASGNEVQSTWKVEDES